MSSTRIADKRAAEINNAVRVAEDILAKRTSWRGRPFHVEISTNNACNLACVMCERPDLSYIDGDKLAEVASEVFPAASVVTPSATSEPAMGDFDRMLDLCSTHDLKLDLITNANLLTDRHIARLRGRIHKVDVSVDSHLPGMYEEIRVGGSHARMLAGLRRLVALQREEGFRLTLVCVLMRQNLTTLDGLITFAHQEGVQYVRIQKMLPFFTDPHRFHVDECFTPHEIRLHLDRALATARHLGIGLHLALDEEQEVAAPPIAQIVTTPAVILAIHDALFTAVPGLCRQLSSYVRILPNGNVYPCCRGWDDHLLMGNIFQSSFEAIWNGPAYQQLRGEFLSGELREGCRRCTLSGLGTL
ncbi:MAG: radical SAM protein [Planctomycetes bacterium]|nr:radical SAM protein [Planctomycetota bacterium]